jgi:CHAT domain-containing protein
VSAPAGAESTLIQEADALQELVGRGDYEKARAAALALAARARAAGDRRALAKSLMRLGDALYYLGRTDETWHAYEGALAAFTAIDDAAGIAEAYYNLAYRYERTRPHEMIALLEKARPFAARADDPRLGMRIENATGTAYWALSRLDRATEHVEAAARIAEQIKDLRYLATLRGNLGMLEENRGHHDEALRLMTLALEHLQTITPAPPALANTLEHIAEVHLSLGDLERATSFYERALDAQRAFGVKRGQAEALEGLAAVADRLGEQERALTRRREALALSLEIEDQRRAIPLLCGIADGLVALARAAEAVVQLDDAEARARGNDPGLLVSVFTSRVALERSRGRASAALQYAQRAEQLAHTIGDTAHEGLCASLRGEIFEELGRPAEAIAAYEHAVALHTATHTRARLHVWHGRIAHLHAQAGAVGRAAEHYEASLRAVEDLGRFLETDSYRLHLFQEVAGLYRDYAAWLALRGDGLHAWEVLERGRARTLQLHLLRAGVPSATAPEEEEALSRLSALQKRLGDANTRDERERLRGLIEEAESEYESALRRRTRGAPSTTAASLSFPQADVVVEYAASTAGLVVLSRRDGLVRTRVVPEAAVLLDRARRFQAEASRAGRPFAAGAEAAALYRALLEPELTGLAAGRLILVPDDALLGVPFAALTTSDGAWLGERFVISQAPSLATLHELQRRPGSGAARGVAAFATTLSVGRPRLPATAAEARRAAGRAWGSQVLVDPDEAAVKHLEFSRFQVLHFATHTEPDEARPERSSIVLRADAANDGALQAREINRLAIPCALVVVSGCRSGRGRLVAGEGLLGLSHSLFAAGAGSLLLSHWDVTDDGAAAFMARFYDALPGRSIAEALHQTQRKAIRAGESPAAWAAFFVSGDADQQLHFPRIAPGDMARGGWLLAGACAVGLAALAVRRRSARSAGSLAERPERPSAAR